LQQAYRPSTQKSQDYSTFLLAIFALFYDVSFPSVSVPTILSFIEFLADNGYAAPTIRTYISSIKSKFNSAGLSVSSFSSPQVSLALISLSKIGSPMFL
jgi:hypothetical protein